MMPTPKHQTSVGTRSTSAAGTVIPSSEDRNSSRQMTTPFAVSNATTTTKLTPVRLVKSQSPLGRRSSKPKENIGTSLALSVSSALLHSKTNPFTLSRGRLSVASALSEVWPPALPVKG